MYEKKIQIKIGTYKGVEVEETEIVVTEEELLKELENARNMAVKTETKEGAAELGDETVIDFVGYIDGEAFAGGDGTDYPLKLGSNTFIPGFEEQLVGAKKDDEVDVKVTFPENYHAPEFAGKEALFKVTVKAVRTGVVPELSDEVVQQVSPCKTVAEFKEYVKTAIFNYKKEQHKMDRENKVLEKIVGDSEIEVPSELVYERKEQLKDNLLAQLRNAGNTFEQYLEYNHLTADQFEEYAQRDALTMLKGQAVLQEIARIEGFTYTREDVDGAIAAMAASYQMPAEQLLSMMGDRGVAMVKEDLLSRQALDFIVKESVSL